MAVGRGGLFPALRADRRGVISRRGGHEPRGRSAVRPGVGHSAGVLCVFHRRDARVPGRALPVARCGAAALRRVVAGRRRGLRARWRVLPVHAAPAAAAVLPGQPGDGADADPRAHLLLGQPAGDARRHAGVRERGHATRARRGAVRYRLALAAAVLRAAGRVPPDCPARARGAAGAPGVREMAAPASLRAQPGGDRRRRGGAGQRLHRGHGEGQRHAGRGAAHGRGLPQHRLRAEQGADPQRAARARDAPCRAVRAGGGRAARRFQARDRPCAGGGARDRAARQRGALQRAGCRGARGARAHRRSVDRGGAFRRRPRHAASRRARS